MEVIDRFKSMAQEAAAALGIPWQWIYAQWGHETGGFTSYLARTYNNFGGLTGADGDFRQYGSDQAFVNSYVNDFLKLMPRATAATSLEGFAQGLRDEGYYTDSVDNYLGGLNRFLPEGAAGGSGETYWRPAEVPADAPDPSQPYWKRVLYYNKLIVTGQFAAAAAYKGTWTDSGRPESEVSKQATAAVEEGNSGAWGWVEGKVQAALFIVIGLAAAITGAYFMAKNETLKLVKEG